MPSYYIFGSATRFLIPHYAHMTTKCIEIFPTRIRYSGMIFVPENNNKDIFADDSKPQKA
jgi:hypothetical protein